MIFEKICEIVAEQFAVARDSLTRDTSFTDDLSADSLDIVELTLAIEEEFGLPEITEEQMQTITTIGDLADMVGAETDD